MSYIEFNLVEKKPKTSIYTVRNIKSQTILGWIRWYSSWRQYCFFPEPNTLFSAGCLNEITAQIDLLKKTNGVER